jgi:hypothetical protein
MESGDEGGTLQTFGSALAEPNSEIKEGDAVSGIGNSELGICETDRFKVKANRHGIPAIYLYFIIHNS